MKKTDWLLPLVLLNTLLLVSCASSGGVDMEEPARVLGKEDDVRVDAQFYAPSFGQGSQVAIAYEIENLRKTPIAFANINPEVSYESETGTFTITVGSEVPGNQMVPRLTEIKPGERLKFTEGGRLVVPVTKDLQAMTPNEIRLKLVYLNEVEPFRALIGIPEVALRDPVLADKLFPLWIEHAGTVVTNAAPIRWGGSRSKSGVEEATPRGF